MFCTQCGKYADGDGIVCNDCAAANASTNQDANGLQVAGAESDLLTAPSIAPTESTETPHEAPKPSAPYPRFVMLFLASALLSSGAAFLIAYSLPFQEPRKLGVAIALSAASLITAAFSWRAWSQIAAMEPEQGFELADRHRSVLRTSIVMVLLAWSVSGLMGHLVGTSGAAMERLLAHAHRSRELTSSIFDEGDLGGLTIPEAVQTLESLQPEAEELQHVLEQLKGDWKDYRSRFPNDSSIANKREAEVDVLIKQDALLLQQIEVAKEIEPLRSPNQAAMWNDKMLPLITEADALLKDANNSDGHETNDGDLKDGQQN